MRVAFNPTVAYQRVSAFLLILVGLIFCPAGVQAQADPDASVASGKRCYCFERGERPAPAEEQVTVEQGIYGRVMLWEGDYMPSPASPDSNAPCRGLIVPVSRPVVIYPATRPEDTRPAFRHPVTGPSAFLTKVDAEPIETVHADEDGFYQVRLPPGRYSVFPVVAGRMFYAPSQSGAFLGLVTVEPGMPTKRSLRLDWSMTE